MSDLKGLRVAVAGAGAIGSVLALELVRRGARVVLADPAPAGANASGVAAGMLAPLSESLLDAASAGHYSLLLRARDAWPAVAEAASGVVLDRSGALLKAASPEAAEALLARAAALGARMDRNPAHGLPGEGAWLFTPEDWRLDPRAALLGLHAAFAALGGQRVAAAITALDEGIARFDAAEPWPADVVVLATGPAGGAWPDAAIDRLLTPIKGQILRFPGVGPTNGCVVRADGVYIAPGAEGAVVGATMEAGRSDLIIDPEAVKKLRARAAGVYPHLADAPFMASVGVRAATPDGLPLVGAARRPGVLIARGARRNGWLLAPLIAQVLIDHLLERAPNPAAEAFDPTRFG